LIPENNGKAHNKSKSVMIRKPAIIVLNRLSWCSLQSCGKEFYHINYPLGQLL